MLVKDLNKVIELLQLKEDSVYAANIGQGWSNKAEVEKSFQSMKEFAECLTGKTIVVENHTVMYK